MDTSNDERRDDETIAKPFDQTNGMMPDADRSDPLRAGDSGDEAAGDRGEATAAATMAWKRSG
jgi:hypothetical protein